MSNDNKLDYAATLEEEFDKLGGLCFLVDVLDEDKQLTEDTINFLLETGRDFDQIIYGAVGLGLYLAECLHPGDYYSVIDEFRKYWITDVSIHEGMTTIIDAALERAKTRLQAEKEITEQFISGKEPTLR